MTGDSDGEPTMAMLTADSLVNQRKTRKGTRSCWECKRRNIRCIFLASGETTCICCQRRRVPCISQEIPESLALSGKSNRGLGDRIARIEDALNDLLVRKGVGATLRIEDDVKPKEQYSLSDVSGPTSVSFRAPPTPDEVSGNRPLQATRVFFLTIS